MRRIPCIVLLLVVSAPLLTPPLLHADPPAAPPLREPSLRDRLSLKKAAPEGQKDAQGKVVSDVTVHVDAQRRTRAEADWQRRAEVCQKLRAIAAQTNDAELERFAERLDQRAWDTYMKAIGPFPSATPVEDAARRRGAALEPTPRDASRGKIYEVTP